MDIIEECVKKTTNVMNTSLNYTEANYQTTLDYFLSKFGSVQKECIISYQFQDEGKTITFGQGRIDLVFRPHQPSNSVWIIELKISPKPYRLESFFPQVKRYCHHWKQQFGACEGVVICFSPVKTLALQVVNSKLMSDS